MYLVSYWLDALLGYSIAKKLQFFLHKKVFLKIK